MNLESNKTLTMGHSTRHHMCGGEEPKKVFKNVPIFQTACKNKTIIGRKHDQEFYGIVTEITETMNTKRSN